MSTERLDLQSPCHQHYGHHAKDDQGEDPRVCKCDDNGKQHAYHGLNNSAKTSASSLGEEWADEWANEWRASASVLNFMSEYKCHVYKKYAQGVNMYIDIITKNLVGVPVHKITAGHWQISKQYTQIT